MAVYILLAAGFLMAFGRLSEGGKCPADTMAAMNNCTAKMSIDLQSAQGHKFLTEEGYAKKMCESSDMTKAQECIEGIFNDCQNEGDDVMIVNPNNWKMAVQEMCDNRKFITDNKNCLQTAASDLGKCVKEATDKASADRAVKGLTHTVKGKQNTKEMLQLICDLSEQLLVCFDNSILKHCPKKLEQIIDDVYHKMLPPLCNAGDKTGYQHVNDNDTGAAERVHVTSLLVFVVAVCLTRFL